MLGHREWNDDRKQELRPIFDILYKDMKELLGENLVEVYFSRPKNPVEGEDHFDATMTLVLRRELTPQREEQLCSEVVEVELEYEMDFFLDVIVDPVVYM